jgi:hypothetical protein
MTAQAAENNQEIVIPRAVFARGTAFSWTFRQSGFLASLEMTRNWTFSATYADAL